MTGMSPFVPGRCERRSCARWSRATPQTATRMCCAPRSHRSPPRPRAEAGSGTLRRMTTTSWRNIQHGWDVCCSGGTPIGHVFLVVGDENDDIFDGLAITQHNGPFVFHNYVDRPHDVAAEQVASIDEGKVTLTLSESEARALPVHN